MEISVSRKLAWAASIALGLIVLDAPGLASSFRARPDASTYAIGDRFQILVDLDRQAHVAVVEIDATGTLTQTHPPPDVRPEPVPAGVSRPLFADDDIVRQAGPPGRNDYLVIATPRAYWLPRTLMLRGLVTEQDRRRALRDVVRDIGPGAVGIDEFAIRVGPSGGEPEVVPPPAAPHSRPPPGTSASGDGAARRLLAVLVGVNDYTRWEGASSLRFAEDDARAVHQVLSTGRNAELRLLTGAAANRQAVETAIARLVSASAPGDVLLYFQSGHGVLVGDPGAPGVQRTCLLLADSSPADPLRSTLTDGAIGKKLLDAAPGRHVVVILDACYSGAGTKGRSGLTVKSARAPRFATAGGAGLKYVVDGRVAVNHQHPGLVLFAASQFTQMAFEDPDRGHGLLTAAVLEALPAPTTTGELAAAVRTRVPAWARRRGHDQTPVVIDRTGGRLKLLEER